MRVAFWSSLAAASLLGAVGCSQRTSSAGVDHSGHGVHADVKEAVCVLMPIAESGVHGIINFHQVDGSVAIQGDVWGLKPGKHGFHVHQFGDLSDAKEGKSAGDHFNPAMEKHGAQDAAHRHAGDFGNIEADAEGHAKINFTDKLATIHGKTSILGRSLVVHADEDKFTQPTGDAGGRVAFGVIGAAKPVK